MIDMKGFDLIAEGVSFEEGVDLFAKYVEDLFKTLKENEQDPSPLQSKNDK